ncbi:MAG: hypothetical protein MJ209_00115 [archaeon]|nr:hypothetical protein [archaeon]
MGRIIIVEEKAEMMVGKLKKMKSCIDELIECISEHIEESEEGGYYPEDENWDDEYEIKRRKNVRQGFTNMRRPMGYMAKGISRY